MAGDSPTHEINDDGEEDAQPVQPFKYYLTPEVTHKIVATEWGFFTLLSGLVYLTHLFWCVYGIDAFSSWTRHTKCGAGIQTIQQAEDMFKVPIAMCVFFHMIEWLRQTIFATTAMVNVNLIKVYYALSFNCIFGIIAMGWGIIAGFGADEACLADVGGQKKRVNYLKFQLLALLVYIPMAWLHVVYFKVRGVDWCHEVWLAEEDEDDD